MTASRPAFPPGRRAALERLEAFRPERYARSRNFLDGAVSALSPYLRHGILDLAQVRDAIFERGRKRYEVEKFIAELGWRDYFRRIYSLLGNRIWEDIEAYKTGFTADTYAAALPADIRTGTTGAACIDGFVYDLVDGGYVHNHARMYFASYVVHHRRVRWQAGAAFYLPHLLDGDAASNNLSWQWVASTFADKPYIFNRDNLERYTGGTYCGRCPLASGGCPFDADYRTLDQRLFPHKHDDRGTVSPAAPLDVCASADARQSDLTPAAPVVIWAHTDALNDENAARRAHPDAPVIFAWDAAMRAADGWSRQRVAFINGALREMRVDARDDGDAGAAIVAFARSHNAGAVLTMATPEPRLREIMDTVRLQLPVHELAAPPFAHLNRPTDMRRFSRYWRQVEPEVMSR
ncbi:MAG: hypothetical protein NVS2B17_32430 [Candidatus Velthaea sp.]